MVTQWIFQELTWVMVGGIVQGATTIAGLILLWRPGRTIIRRLASRDRGAKLALGGAVGALLPLMVGTGIKSSDLMTHDNDFCGGCEIFVRSPTDITCHARTAQRFQPGDTTCARQGFHLTDSTRFWLTSSRELPRGLTVPGRRRSQGAAPPEDGPPERQTDVSVSPSDTFPHERHSRLACLTCHDLRSEGRRLTFEAPGGCQVCHHQRPAQAKCASCHHAGELAATLPVQVAVAVPRHDRRRRTVQFPHAKHDTLACTGCHVTPVTLAPADSVRTCAGCHAEHHAESRDCAACHQTAATAALHQRPIQAHVACGACHNPATVARLVPTRSFCLACHTPQQDHYQPKECSTCHFQRTPAELQRKLGRGGARS